MTGLTTTTCAEANAEDPSCFAASTLRSSSGLWSTLGICATEDGSGFGSFISLAAWLSLGR